MAQGSRQVQTQAQQQIQTLSPQQILGSEIAGNCPTVGAGRTYPFRNTSDKSGPGGRERNDPKMKMTTQNTLRTKTEIQTRTKIFH